jgi:Caspase domain
MLTVSGDSMPNNLPRAVIIGINHYDTFDKAVGLEEGSSNLFGAINDCKLYYQLARRIGAPAKNITVITSAPVSSSFIGDESGDTKLISPATKDVIMEAIIDLIKQLAKDEKSVGFVAFSGHGDYLEEDQQLVLCPQDTTIMGYPLGNPTELRLKNVVPLLDIRNLTDKHPNINLTYILDVCHASGDYDMSLLKENAAALETLSDLQRYVATGGDVERFTVSRQTGEVTQQQVSKDQVQQVSRPPRSAARAGGGSLKPTGEATLERPTVSTTTRCLTRRALLSRPPMFSNTPDVVLVAAETGKPAYEFAFNGVWNGAFTLALSNILDRWAHQNEKGFFDLKITNIEVLARAEAYVRSLDFDQKPTYIGRNELRSNRILNAESATLTTHFTDKPRPARMHELSPGAGPLGYRAYNLDRYVAGTWVNMGQVLVVGANDVSVGLVSFEKNTSYWWWSGGVSPFAATYSLQEAAALTVAGASPVTASARYENKEFVGTSKSLGVVPTTHDIRINLLNAPLIGFLQAAGGVPASLTYYMLNGVGQAPPYFNVASADRLVFSFAARNPSVTGWRQVDNKL